MQVAFRAHDLDTECALDGIEVKMQVTGGYECQLALNADREVEGVCPRIPAGAVREFRLVYYTVLSTMPDVPLDLAVALTTVDLTGYDRADLVLVFPQESVSTDIDDDQDNKVNLFEWCTGTNPRFPD